MTDNEKLMEFLVDLQHNAELSNDGVSNIKDQVISCLGDDAITITGLRMDHLGLRTLPDSLVKLKGLKYLHLNDNKFSEFPEVICELTNLEELYLDHNQLTIIPESFGKLVNLKELDLSYNKIQILPESISDLSKLFNFHVDFNQLTSLPNSFGNISSKAISSWDGERYFIFSLTNNKIASLPSSMINLPEKGELYLECNNLEYIPEKFFNFISDKCYFLLYLASNPIYEKLKRKGWMDPQ